VLKLPDTSPPLRKKQSHLCSRGGRPAYNQTHKLSTRGKGEDRTEGERTYQASEQVNKQGSAPVSSLIKRLPALRPSSGPFSENRGGKGSALENPDSGVCPKGCQFSSPWESTKHTCDKKLSRKGKKRGEKAGRPRIGQTFLMYGDPGREFPRGDATKGREKGKGTPTEGNHVEMRTSLQRAKLSLWYFTRHVRTPLSTKLARVKKELVGRSKLGGEPERKKNCA